MTPDLITLLAAKKEAAASWRTYQSVSRDGMTAEAEIDLDVKTERALVASIAADKAYREAIEAVVRGEPCQ